MSEDLSAQFATANPISIKGVKVAFGLGGGLLRFAHHPHCDRHLHHLIWLKGRPFCLGCMAMGAGIPFGVLAALLISWSHVPIYVWIIGHGVLVVPTALQPFIQKKAYKIFARTLLGVSTASYLVSGLFQRAYFESIWLWHGSVVIAFAVGFLALYKWRQKRSNNPCDDCPLGQFPTCEWNMPRLLSQNILDPLWIKIAEDLTNLKNKNSV